MAAQRAIERDNVGEINLVAAAHLAGPYNGRLILFKNQASGYYVNDSALNGEDGNKGLVRTVADNVAWEWDAKEIAHLYQSRSTINNDKTPIIFVHGYSISGEAGDSSRIDRF